MGIRLASTARRRPTFRSTISILATTTSGGSTTTCAMARSHACAARPRSPFTASPAGRLPSRRRALGADDTRRRVPRQSSPGDLQLQPEHHHRRPGPRGIRVLRLDDRARRPAAPAAAADRQQGVHPEGGRPHRGLRARPGPPAGRPDGRRSSRRQCDLVNELAGPLPLQVICDMMGIPEEDHQHIFHWTNVILGFGDPDLRPTSTTSLRCRRRSAPTGRARRGPARQPPRGSHDQPGRSRSRRRAADLGRGRVVLHPAGGRRQRDHPQRDQPRAGGPDPLSRAAGAVVVRLRRPSHYGGRGDRALGVTGDLHAAHPHPDIEISGTRWPPATRSTHVVLLRQPRRVQVRRPVEVRCHPRPESARRLRRRESRWGCWQPGGGTRLRGRRRRVVRRWLLGACSGW